MSLILEALRKSEAERQVGRLPGLMTPTAPLRRRRSKAPQMLITAALLIALVAGAWWLGRQGQPVPMPAQVTAPTAAPAPATNADQAPAPAAAGPQRSADAGGAAAAKQAAEPARPAPAQHRPATDLPLPGTVASAPATAPAPAVAPATAAPGPAAAVDADHAMARVEPATTPQAPAVPEPFFPTLEQMPAAQRSGLPTLKLSVHVYADDPAARFAIVDGRRVQEAAELAPGLRVREIRRDGVLLDVAGQPWLLAWQR